MQKIIHRPEEYTISVKLEDIEGDWLYVARVLEIPDIVEYADDANFARELALDSISTSKEMCENAGISFPAPSPSVSDSYSGRVTLRIPKDLHRICALSAEKQGVTLNHYLSTMLATGEANSQVLSHLDALTKAVVKASEEINIFHSSKWLDIPSQTIAYTRHSRTRLVSGFRSEEVDDEEHLSMPAFIANALSCG
ncbi:toxin-antitoxin system HicB family antitoxin [Rahnella aceris]|jgi:predicted HicB family RNase H-like nuclease